MQNKFKFIKVHNSDTNEVELYNIEKIMTIYFNNDIEVPCICLTDGSEYYCNETPNRIYEWIKNDGFIRGHSFDSNKICLINLRFIMSVYRNKTETLVSMKSSDEEIEISLNETPERLYNLIEELNSPVQVQTKKKKVETKQENIKN